MFLLKHWDRKNKFRIFFHKMPTSRELIPKNTSFFMPQLQKYAEWNIISVLLIKAIFLQVNK